MNGKNLTEIQELYNLANQIFIFEPDLIAEIKNRIPHLTAAVREELKSILREAVALEQKLIADKIIADPQFFETMLTEKEQANREILALVKQGTQEHDTAAIEALQTRIKNL